ncbi:MAG: hypothetical protein ACPG52_02655 [Cognaticolwellia sp.]
MEIQSAFNAGVQGFQKASEDATQAAANIAANMVTTPNDTNLDQTNLATFTASTDANSESLTKSVIDLRVAEFQAKASANVVEAADENLGTLLDVRV